MKFKFKKLRYCWWWCLVWLCLYVRYNVWHWTIYVDNKSAATTTTTIIIKYIKFILLLLIIIKFKLITKYVSVVSFFYKNRKTKSHHRFFFIKGCCKKRGAVEIMGSLDVPLNHVFNKFPSIHFLFFNQNSKTKMSWNPIYSNSNIIWEMPLFLLTFLLNWSLTIRLMDFGLP